MQVQISKWGNSLGVRIPKAFAEMLKLDAGHVADLKIDENRLIIQPFIPDDSFSADLKEIDLKSMTDQITEDNKNHLPDPYPRGQETW